MSLTDPFNQPIRNSHSSILRPPPPPPPPPPPALYHEAQPIQTNPGYGSYHLPSGQVGPAVTASSTTLYGYSGYDLNDEHNQDEGDIPLLARGPSSSSVSIHGPPIPGSYEDDRDDMSSIHEEPSNIRYGRIPQRVPRRYKTVKKFE